ncbi:MAG: hypothetical protein JNL94_05920 [Planctomycetes bacterium]|nr:hypothetical protein [Planctomycetota bacterium]
MKANLILSALAVVALVAVAPRDAEAGKVKVNIGVGIGFANPHFGTHLVYDNHHKHHHAPAPVVVAPMYPTPVVVAPRCHTPVVYVPARPVVYAPPAFTYVYEQQWVPPVFQTQIIGYDHCGRAITQQVCVAQGYYRTLRYRVYGNGAKVFDGYV